MSGVFAGAWVFAALLRPEVDYVLFPVLVAASFPISYRLALGPLPTPLAGGAAIAGIINTIVVTLLLGVTGLLGDAELLPALGAVGQAMALGAAGGIIGYAASRLGAPHPQ